MKRSFYLFNPGIMERKDNTLKFTPVVVNEENEEIKQQPRFIPIEDVAELYAFEVFEQIVLCSISWDRKVFLSTSSTIMRTIPEASCHEKVFFQARHCWHRHRHTKTRKRELN